LAYSVAIQSAERAELEKWNSSMPPGVLCLAIIRKRLDLGASLYQIHTDLEPDAL
jgi:hypothetical protein